MFRSKICWQTNCDQKIKFYENEISNLLLAKKEKKQEIAKLMEPSIGFNKNMCKQVESEILKNELNDIDQHNEAQIR